VAAASASLPMALGTRSTIGKLRRLRLPLPPDCQIILIARPSAGTKRNARFVAEAKYPNTMTYNTAVQLSGNLFQLLRVSSTDTTSAMSAFFVDFHGELVDNMRDTNQISKPEFRI
jgi:hypothetical protein